MASNPFEDAKIVGKITQIPKSINDKIRENCEFIRDKIKEVCKTGNTSCQIKLPKTYTFTGIPRARSTNLVYGIVIKNLVDKGYNVSINLDANEYAIIDISWPMDQLQEMNDELAKIVDRYKK